MTPASSITTFVMGDRLPWPEEAHPAAAEGPFDGAVVFDAAVRRECWIRRISALGATLRGNVTIAPGKDVAVELMSGQRPGGTIVWAGKGEAGLRFKHPVDLLALINRRLVSEPNERRKLPRVELRCSVEAKWCGNQSAATLRNISAGGMQLEGDALPPVDTYVSVLVDGVNIPPGEVVWRKGNLAGIELFEELSWTSVIPWIRGLRSQERS